MKNGDLTVTPNGTSMVGHVPVSSLKPFTSLHLYNIPSNSLLSSHERHEFSYSTFFSKFHISSSIFKHTSNSHISFFQNIYKSIKLLAKYICTFRSIIPTMILLYFTRFYCKISY